MVDFSSELPPKVTPEELARLNALADQTCDALSDAGIPAHRAEMNVAAHRSGAGVHVDPIAPGNVLVEWETESELADRSLALFEQGVDPSKVPHAIRHHETVVACMRSALLGILSSAGFNAGEADPHTYGVAVWVKGFRKPAESD